MNETLPKFRGENDVNDRIGGRIDRNEENADGDEISRSNELRNFADEIRLEEQKDEHLWTERDEIDQDDDEQHFDHVATGAIRMGRFHRFQRREIVRRACQTHLAPDRQMLGRIVDRLRFLQRQNVETTKTKSDDGPASDWNSVW